MSTYRKRPLEIEAEQWNIGNPWGNSPKFRAAVCVCDALGTWHIHTIDGPHPLRDRDWITIGIEGERYPIRDSIFRASYDAVPDGVSA